MKKVLNFSTKIKRKGIVRPAIFNVIPYPDKKSPLSRFFVIVINLGGKDWYLDHNLTLNSNYECAGIWTSEEKAHMFILEKFYD